MIYTPVSTEIEIDTEMMFYKNIQAFQSKSKSANLSLASPLIPANVMKLLSRLQTILFNVNI